MKTTIPKLRRMIRKVITESMSPQDPDYEMVAEVIMQITRKLFSMRDHKEIFEEIVATATDYGVGQHFEYIEGIVMEKARRMGIGY